MNLDEKGNFTIAYGMFKDLMLNILDWMMTVNIGGVPILYINLGFVLMITLFAVILPVLRSYGAAELTNDYAKSAAQRIEVSRQGRAPKGAPRLRGGPGDPSYK